MENKKIKFMSLLIVLGSFATLIYLAMMGNTDQVYSDIVSEYTSIFSSNKSIERTLLFGLIFAGIAVYFCFSLWVQRKNNKSIGTCDFTKCDNIQTGIIASSIVTIAATYLLVFTGTYPLILGCIIYMSIVYLVERELIINGFCLYFVSAYTICAVYRISVLAGNEKTIGTNFVAICALVIACIPLAMKNKERTMQRLCLLEQILLPGVLFVYFIDKYKTSDGSCVFIKVPMAIKVTVIALIIIFALEALLKLIKTWKIDTSVESIISIGSCISIMALNCFNGTGAIITTDMHHPYENIIGFSQIFELGQKPFENYIPISGMYSIVQGAFLRFFGNGEFGNYNVTNNLLYLLIVILIVLALKTQIHRVYLFLISLTVFVLNYNRLAFMLPIMLLLIHPKLVEKKNAWLLTWFITSLFQGLYYPLYGVGTCIAFLPLAIWQVVTYLKSGELKRDVRTSKFWIGWIVASILLILSIKCLFGSIIHMLAMSGQSVLADGISRFGQFVPGWFFPYLSDYTVVRIALYYIFTWIIPAAFVWVAFVVFMKAGAVSIVGKRIRINNAKDGCITLSLVIMPVICYTYTFTRLDISSIYARSTGVLIAGSVLLLIFAIRYIDLLKVKYLLICVAFFVPVVSGTCGISSLDSKLISNYSVPNGYVYVKKDAVEKLGTGFVEKNLYNTIETTKAKFEARDKGLSYMGSMSDFGYYYLSNIKGDGPIEVARTVKGFSAAREAVDYARRNHSIIGYTFDTFSNYYFYHWILTSGEYIWQADKFEFVPNDGQYTKEEVLEQNKNLSLTGDGLNTAELSSSFGLSMKSLRNIFNTPDVNFTTTTNGNGVNINFSKAIDGDNADFMYIEFANMDRNYEYTLYNLDGEVAQVESYAKYFMKKRYNSRLTVSVGWLDENGKSHNMTCAMSKGKLLIPLGAAQKWLLNDHTYVNVSILQDGHEISIPKISNIEFLKLREVK